MTKKAPTATPGQPTIDNVSPRTGHTRTLPPSGASVLPAASTPSPAPARDGHSPRSYHVYEGDDRHGLVVVVWNVAGLMRATNALMTSPDFLTMLNKHDPDIVMIQETWLGARSKGIKAAYLSGYRHYKSVAAREETPGQLGRHKGGVSTWVRKALRPENMISEEFRETSAPLRGYALPLVLDDGHTPLLMINTYLPPPPPDPASDTRRPTIMQGIHDVITLFRARHPGGGVLVAGDFNAAYNPLDREKGPRAFNNTDRTYHDWTRSVALTPMDYRCSQPGLREFHPSDPD
jgi:exonuclease III